MVGVAPFVYSKALIYARGRRRRHHRQGRRPARRSARSRPSARNITPPLDSIPDSQRGSTARDRARAPRSPRVSGRGVGERVVLATLDGAVELARSACCRGSSRSAVAGIFQLRPLHVRLVVSRFTSIAAAQDLSTPRDAVTGIQVQIVDMFQAPAVAKAGARGPGRHRVRTNNWVELNRTCSRWMKLEKAVMFVILALIVLVAAFNIVSTLFMVVIEKRRDIGVLKRWARARV